MIFPNLGPQYYTENDRGLLARMENSYQQSITINQSFWAEANIDSAYECGNQSVWDNYYGSLPIAGRRTYNFNHIRPAINLIDGYQRRNRKSTIAVPVENADERTADDFSKLLMQIHGNEGIYDTISNAFRGALVTGMNLLQVWLDYRKDPISGDIKVDNCPHNSFLIDPFFKKADLSDCNFIWKRSWLTKQECISLLPDREDEIISLSSNEYQRDGKFQFQPESYGFSYKDLMTYDEYYYRDYRTQILLVDTQTGDSTEWRGEEDESLREYLEQFPQVEVLKQEVPTVNLGIVIQGKVIWHGPNPLGIDSYPFIPVFAYYSPEIPYFEWRIQGVVRALRAPQFLMNRRAIIITDACESVVNTGWIYKENALVDPKSVYMTGQGRGIAIKKDAQISDIQQITPPQMPPAMFQLVEMFDKEINKISGVNEELLGAAVDDKAGILSMLRQGAGITQLQILFDRLDFAQKLLGKLMIDIIQANYTPGKVAKIIHREPSPEFYNKNFGRYDAAIEEGLNTTTQKQMQFAQLLQLREAGIQIPDTVLIKAATLQNKTELVEALEQNAQQQQQIQQMQMQAALQEQQARTQLAQARATADEGLGIERMSRVQENAALAEERRAQAKKDDEVALLNKVKALKELESLDLTHLQTLINLAQTLNRAQTNEPENQTMMQK